METTAGPMDTNTENKMVGWWA